MDTVAAVYPLEGPVQPAPNPAAGAAAEAIRRAETALARQNSVTANVDLQVVAAVLNAHSTHGAGAAALEELQHEIESAVATRTGLDTPAGAREFQRYLVDRLHDIRAVVDDACLDDTSKAALAAALAALYSTAGSAETAGSAAPAPAPPAPPAPPGPPGPPSWPRSPEPPAPDAAPLDLGLGPVPDSDVDSGLDVAGDPGPPVAGPAPPPALPSISGGVPAPAMPSLGLPPLSALSGLAPLRPTADGPAQDPQTGSVPEETGSVEPESVPDQTESPPGEKLSGVIAAAVAGTPIAEAFGLHGIAIPEPGSPVSAPLDASQVIAGDVGILTDRHALALGNGKALLDNQIVPIDAVNRPGFIGWQHPGVPQDPSTEPARAPEPPARTPPVLPAD